MPNQVEDPATRVRKRKPFKRVRGRQKKKDCARKQKQPVPPKRPKGAPEYDVVRDCRGVAVNWFTVARLKEKKNSSFLQKNGGLRAPTPSRKKDGKGQALIHHRNLERTNRTTASMNGLKIPSRWRATQRGGLGLFYTIAGNCRKKRGEAESKV